MELIAIALAAIVALLILDVLAMAFGRDSRDSFADAEDASADAGRQWFAAGGSR